MFSIRSFRSGDAVARPGATSTATFLALTLLLAACGSEAENAASAGQQAAEKTAATASESGAAQEPAQAEDAKNMMADAGAAAEKTAAKEEEAKQEEQKREPMDGYTVYNRFCTVCHKQGMNGAPKFRDKEAWQPRIAKGKETLYKHSIEGFRAMPAKGGIAGLYDQEVKDAVDFMVKNVGGWESASK
jgi:cytochrome c5